MITRHHVALALMCSLIVGTAIVPVDPVLFIVLAGSTCIGAVLPDIQMTRPKKSCALSLAWYVVQFTKRVCLPLMCRSYRLIPGFRVESCDKRLTHSVPGVLFILGILTGTLYGISAFAGQFHQLVAVNVFLAGVFLGMVLHLAEDLCTRKGIAPFYPFCDLRASGAIRPCDTRDRRIARFHAQHCSVLIAFLALFTAGLVPADFILPVSLAGITVCVAWMISLSSVRLCPGAAPPSRVPTVNPNPTAS